MARYCKKGEIDDAASGSSTSKGQQARETMASKETSGPVQPLTGLIPQKRSLPLFFKLSFYIGLKPVSNTMRAVGGQGGVQPHVRSVTSVGPDSVTSWTAAHQAPLSMGFSKQEYWSGSPCPPPGIFPNLGIEPTSPVASAL